MLEKLERLFVFFCRPTMDGFIPSIAERYRHHILFPVLRLCLSCMTTLGIENTDVTSAVSIITIVLFADLISAVSIIIIVLLTDLTSV